MTVLSQDGKTLDPDFYEAVFSEFWESQECDDLNWVIYDLIKAAFAAGCRAAGQIPPEYPRQVTLRWERKK